MAIPNKTQQQQESDGSNLMQGLIEVLPVLSVLTGVAAAWFNLQGQLIDLRARYEASTVTSKDAIADIRSDIKETNKLIREMLADQRNQPVINNNTGK
jgi:hypothetical protein